MRNRLPQSTAGSVFVFLSLLIAVPNSYGQTGDIQDILDHLEGLPFDEFIDAS